MHEFYDHATGTYVSSNSAELAAHELAIRGMDATALAIPLPALPVVEPVSIAVSVIRERLERIDLASVRAMREWLTATDGAQLDLARERMQRQEAAAEVLRERMRTLMQP